jgi:hypothetical protein
MKKAVVLAVVLAGCGGNDPNGDPVDTDAEVTATAQHGSIAGIIGSAKGISSLFVAEDPTLDPTKSAGQNTGAIAAQLMSAAGSCGSVMYVTGQVMVSVNFGAGCSLPPLGNLSGSVTAKVTSMNGVTVLLTFSNLGVDGQTLNGTLSLATADGTTFTYRANLNDGSVKVLFDGTLALDGAGGVTADGTGSIDTGATPIDLTITGLHHKFGGCYADAGTISESKMVRSLKGNMVMISDAIAFDAQTPSTGMATITVGNLAKTTTLMSYGNCPHP